MYDPLSGEGLVCVNGRCISNKRKMRMHDEDQIGINGSNNKRGNRRKNPPQRKKRVRPQHNGIPMNPYENIDPSEEDKIESEDEDADDLVPFEDQEELLDENFRDGNVYNYSGNKKQEPQKPKAA